jgi:xylulokinase
MINMNYYLGIDLGTSSVKAILVSRDGCVIRKERCPYSEVSLSGWDAALKQVLNKTLENINREQLSGIAFSSQVGTYITDSGDIVGWWESAGREELKELKLRFSDSEFLREISMIHPDIVSYPLPRYMYIKKHFSPVCRVMMPKEYFIERLSDNYVSDCYSYRGLYNFDKKRLSSEMLSLLEVDFKLPDIKDPCDVAGFVTDKAAAEYGLPRGCPLYLGMNDFYSGLFGMGVLEVGDAFDISGTSEHIGYISSGLVSSHGVSGRYFNGCATYGVTKSSGASIDFAIKNFSACELSAEVDESSTAPVFLPYLNGERAPIYDENAKGVFFGISAGADKKTLGYSVLEGVAFSLYDIANSINMPSGGRLIVGGGAANNPLLARLKAELLLKDVFVCSEPDASALGAAMCAMVGDKVFPDKKAAVGIVKYKKIASPTGVGVDRLLSRFETYRSVYSALKQEFANFSLHKE